LVQVQDRTEAINQRLNAPDTGLVGSLTRSLAQHAEISKKAAQQAAIIHALTVLQSCRDALVNANRLLQAGRLDDVVSGMDITQKAVHGPHVEPWIRNIQFWKSSQQWLEQTERLTKDRLTAAAESCFVVQSSESGRVSLQILPEAKGPCMNRSWYP